MDFGEKILLILCTIGILIVFSADLKDDKQVKELTNRVVVLEQQVSTYNDTAVEMFSSYNEMRKTQLTLISLYEDNGKFNK